MTMHNITRLGPILFASCIAGCAVGPDFKRPDPPAVTGYTRDPIPPQTVSATGGPSGSAQAREAQGPGAQGGGAQGGPQRFVPGADIPGEWWQVFHNEPLNKLIQDSLTANPTLTAAQAALRQAHENTLAQTGFYYPSVTGSFDASRNLTPTESLSPAGPTTNPYYSLVTPQLSVSFTPDVWGANRRAVESLAAQEESQLFQLEATYLTLTSNVVAGAVQEASLRGQIAATSETIKVETSLLDILRRQMQLGQMAGADVAAQEAALAQAQLLLPPLQKQLALQRDALTALAGRYPSEEVEATFDLAGLALPLDLPLSIPSALVQQRPDVRQAEANLHAASAQIGQAIAARIPAISLTASLGNSASSASTLFTPGTNFWTLGAGVTGPIFDGFTLLHKQRAAQAGFDQAAAQYKATVIAAFQNVADSLRALQSDADALRAASASEAAAKRSLDIVHKQLDLGQIAYLAVLNAENTYQQARLALVQAEASRLADTAALFQALGGGWWHRTDGQVASR
jgi:NodT family efflux transporter outer membrane factor (OMF) lipoprotein